MAVIRARLIFSALAAIAVLCAAALIFAGIYNRQQKDNDQNLLRGGKILSQQQQLFPSYNFATWMTDNQAVIYNKTIKEVLFPGTHDSATSGLTYSFVPDDLPIEQQILGIFTPKDARDWAIAQDKSAKDQLELGVRYLDLRVRMDKGRLRTFHALWGDYFDEVLKQVKAFSDTRPGELLLLEVSHFRSGEAEAIAALVESVLGPSLMRSSTGGDDRVPRQTIGSYIALGQRILVAIDDDNVALNHKLWPASSNFFNTYADSCKVDVMRNYNNDRAMDFINFNKNNPALYKLSWTLTPDKDCIIQGILTNLGLARLPNSLLKKADTANIDLGSFYDSHNAMIGNVVLVDHFQTSNIVSIAIGNAYGMHSSVTLFSDVYFAGQSMRYAVQAQVCYSMAKSFNDIASSAKWNLLPEKASIIFFADSTCTGTSRRWPSLSSNYPNDFRVDGVNDVISAFMIAADGNERADYFITL